MYSDAPSNESFALAQRLADQCSEGHSWFHYTRAASLIEQHVDAQLARLAERVAELEGENERLRETLACYADEDAWSCANDVLNHTHDDGWCVYVEFDPYKASDCDHGYQLAQQALAALSPPTPQEAPQP